MAARLPTKRDISLPGVRVSAPNQMYLPRFEGGGAALKDLGRGLSGVVDFALSAQEEDARAAATEAETLFDGAVRDRLYDPEGGYLTTAMGRNAIEQRGSVDADIATFRETYAKNLSPQARKIYDQRVNERMNIWGQTIDTHHASERRSFQAGVRTAAVENERLNVLAQPFDDTAFQASMGRVHAEVNEIGRLKGEAQSLTEIKRREMQGALAASSIDTLLSLGTAEGLRKAKERFEAFGPEIQTDPAAYQRLTNNIRDRSESYEAGALVGAALSGGEYAPQFVGRKQPPEQRIGRATTPMGIAEKLVGKTEQGDHETLAAFLSKAGGEKMDPRTAAWCARFVNSVLEVGGLEGTGSDAARSFLRFGEETRDPAEGDIVVLSRGDPNGWQGHVGFYAGRDDKGNILILGGNQDDSVSVKAFPPGRVLGFRRPPNAAVEAEAGPSVGAAPQQPYGAGSGTPKPSIMERNFFGETEDPAPKLMKAPGPDGGYAATIRWIRSNAPNPRVAEDAIKAYDAELKVIDRARKEEKQQLLDQSFAWAEQNAQTGATIRDLPPEVRRNLGGDLEKVKKYLSTIRGDSDVKTDFAVWQDLRARFEADPDVFRKPPAEGGVDLREYAGSISTSDRKTMRMWSDSRAEGKGASLSTIRSVSQNLLKDAGVKAPGDMAAFEDEIMTRLASRGDVTDQDVFKETQRVLADPAFTQRLQGGPVDADGFDLDLTEIQGTLARTYMVYGMTNRVGELADLELDLIDRLNAYEEEPSDQQIVREARKLLDERGYRPDPTMVRATGDDKTPSVSTISSAIKPVYRALDLRPPTSTSQNDGPLMGRLEQALSRHVAANPGMTQVQIQERAAEMLTPITANGPGWWDQATVRAFELTPEQIDTWDLVIPEDIKPDLEASVQRQGQPVTEENVMKLWRAYLRSLSQ